jgi:signal transduction histidine kinase
VFHNIIKHAQANKIQVNLHFDSTHVTLKITDNGKGFDMQDSRGLGRGIKNMEKRTKLLNGSCLVESKVNHGTDITFSIPLV